MFKPIPSRILQTAVTVKQCTGIDRYQNQTYKTFTVKRTHIQPTNEVKKTESNTDVSLRSILFVDARISSPYVDWCALLQAAQGIKGDVKVIAHGVEYTVMSVDELRDDTDRIHHWEIGLR